MPALAVCCKVRQQSLCFWEGLLGDFFRGSAEWNTDFGLSCLLICLIKYCPSFKSLIKCLVRSPLWEKTHENSIAMFQCCKNAMIWLFVLIYIALFLNPPISHKACKDCRALYHLSPAPLSIPWDSSWILRQLTQIPRLLFEQWEKRTIPY